MPAGYGDDDDVLAVIETNINNAIDFSRAQLLGSGTDECLECGEQIPAARKKILPNCCYCVQCQAQHDHTKTSYFNRRGHHDSQLR